MKKSELVHMNTLYQELYDSLAGETEQDDLGPYMQEYRDFGVRPTSINANKGDYKHALFLLGNSVNDVLEELGYEDVPSLEWETDGQETFKTGYFRYRDEPTKSVIEYTGGVGNNGNRVVIGKTKPESSENGWEVIRRWSLGEPFDDVVEDVIDNPSTRSRMRNSIGPSLRNEPLGNQKEDLQEIYRLHNGEEPRKETDLETLVGFLM